MMEQIEQILDDNGYNYCEYSGCFDIAARKDGLMLLKVLGNIDSFHEEQANNLKALSEELDATSLLIGLHTRREALSDNIMYDRFDIPALTPNALESIIHGSLLRLCRFRGGVFADIDPDKLKSARSAAGLSQSQLARKLGITKKSIYEHESRRMKMACGNATRIEKVLKAKVTVPLDLRMSYNIEISPRSRFEDKISRNFRKMGFETGSVYQSPFNMLARDGHFLVLSDVDEDEKRIKRKVPSIASFSKVSGRSAIIVTKEEANFSIPTIQEKELYGMKTSDIRKLVKKW